LAVEKSVVYSLHY